MFPDHIGAQWWLLIVLFLLGFITRIVGYEYFYEPASQKPYSWQVWYDYAGCKKTGNNAIYLEGILFELILSLRDSYFHPFQSPESQLQHCAHLPFTEKKFMQISYLRGLLVVTLLIFSGKPGFSQATTSFFKDTTTRIGSNFMGALYDKDGSIYLWGGGTSRTSLAAGQVRKVDSSGTELWNTAKSQLLNRGYIAHVYADSNFLYAFGIYKFDYNSSTFFFSKIDKSNGHVYYTKDNSPFNAYGLIDIRDKGPDSIRVVCSPSNPVDPPVVAISINKMSGIAAASIPYGITDIYPLYIDTNDIAYYYTTTDSLVKYDAVQGTVLWRNKTFLAGANYSRPATHLRKENNKIYLFGDRYCRQVDDNTGTTAWNIRMSSRYNHEFWPQDIVFKNDTIYTTWQHPYSPADEYGHFSKFNKNTGAFYLDGTIADTGAVAIDYYATGYFRGYNIIVDSSSDIYLFGHYYNDQTGQRSVKKISWNGNLLSEKKLGVDSMPTLRSNNLISGWGPGAVSGFLRNNQPAFIYAKYIYNVNGATARLCFTGLSNDLSVKTERFYDNNAFLDPSTVVDITRAAAHNYVLKKQGFNVYLEKYFSADSMVWRKELSATCYFTPVTLAIDSLGMICVIGHSVNCASNSDQYSLTHRFPINRAIYLNPDGSIYGAFEISANTTTNKQPNLIGTDNGFFLVSDAGVFKLDKDNVDLLLNTSVLSNFSSSLWNAQSSKIFLTVNDTDSIYVFSTWLGTPTAAFYHAVSKQTLQARKSMITSSFPGGYLMHAVKSLRDSNVAYVAGSAKSPNNYYNGTIAKLNYKTGAVTWKYTSANKSFEFFKVVEDDAGFIYGMATKGDTAIIVKLNGLDGNLVWSFQKIESNRYSKSVDMDINNAGKTLVVAGFNYVGIEYLPYILSLNSQTGALIDLRILKGDIGEPNLIQAVESMQDSVVMIGGNLHSEMLYGKYGYIWFKGGSVPCTTNYWLGSVNNSWENAGNWSCGIVPGPASNVIINGGTVVLGSNTTINTFTLAPGATFLISSGFNLEVLN